MSRSINRDEIRVLAKEIAIPVEGAGHEGVRWDDGHGTILVGVTPERPFRDDQQYSYRLEDFLDRLNEYAGKETEQVSQSHYEQLAFYIGRVSMYRELEEETK